MGLKPSKNWIKSVSACLCLPTPLYSSCLKEPPGWIAMLPRGYPSAHQDSRHSFSTSILVFIPNHAELVIGMVSIKLHFDNVGKITSQILSVTGLQDSEGLSGGLKAKGSAWLSHETEIDRISKRFLQIFQVLKTEVVATHLIPWRHMSSNDDLFLGIASSFQLLPGPNQLIVRISWSIITTSDGHDIAGHSWKLP